MLAGVWILVFLPLMDTLRTSGWVSSVPVPHVFDFCDQANTLDERLMSYHGFFPALMFCMGMVLLFSNEQGRRRGRLDWTSRWGVICCYVVLLLYFTQLLFIAALVLAGIGNLFMAIALKYQPDSINLLVRISSAYLRYGPSPNMRASGVQIIFSAVTVLLGCFPLFNALRSCGSKLFATVLLAPLIVFSLIQMVQGARYFAGNLNFFSANVFFCSVYFWPEVVFRNFADQSDFLQPPMVATVAEATKWCIVLGIAVWLSIAQAIAWQRRRSFVLREQPMNDRGTNSFQATDA
jgi:hypothetical protein